MTMLLKFCAASLIVLFGITGLGCANVQNATSNPVDELVGTWYWLSSCGGCVYECYYPEYRGQVVVEFQQSVFRKFVDGELAQEGTYQLKSIEALTTYYSLSLEDESTERIVYVDSDGYLTFMGGWGQLTILFER